MFDRTNFSRREAIKGASAIMADTMIDASNAAAFGKPNNYQADTGWDISSCNLCGKTAVVTGAAKGIGRSICIALARRGANIFGIDLMESVSTNKSYPSSSEEDMKETEKAITALGVKFNYAKADIRNYDEMQSLAKRIITEMGTVDILVADAGIEIIKPFTETDEQYWTDTMGVNVLGTAYTMRAFVPYMVKQNHGRIIAISSTQGSHGVKHSAAYSGCKWAIVGLVKSTALELGANNITVNAVVPELIAEPEAASVKTTMQTSYQHTWPGPDEVSPAIVFLASDAAKRISGAVYDITGNRSKQYSS